MLAHFRGFTIIELMIVIVIASILLMMAMPSYQGFIKRNNVESLQSRAATAVITARSEAASRNKVTVVCSSDDGSSCANSDWNSGWIVFVDDGEGGGTANNELRDGSEEVILTYNNIGNYRVTITNETGNAEAALAFNPQGFSLNEYRALITICEPDGDVKYARGLIVERSGRSMKTRNLDGDDGIHESRFDDGAGNVTVANLAC